jgi:hypothetical protein
MSDLVYLDSLGRFPPAARGFNVLYGDGGVQFWVDRNQAWWNLISSRVTRFQRTFYCSGGLTRADDGRRQFLTTKAANIVVMEIFNGILEDHSPQFPSQGEAHGEQINVAGHGQSTHQAMENNSRRNPGVCRGQLPGLASLMPRAFGAIAFDFETTTQQRCPATSTSMRRRFTPGQGYGWVDNTGAGEPARRLLQRSTRTISSPRSRPHPVPRRSAEPGL